MIPAGENGSVARGTSGSTLWLIFLGGLVLVLAFWWLGSGSKPVRSIADQLNATGRVAALVGTYLILWQLLLVARVPWLEEAFGMERLALLHRWNAYPAVGLIVAHVVLQTLGYQIDSHVTTLAQLGDFVAHYDGLLGAIVGFLLLVAVTLLSVAIARRYLSYHAWYFVHLYSYLAVALAFVHQLATGVDFIDNPLFVAYWYALYVVVIGSLVLYRVLSPMARFAHHRFRVQRVQREANGTVSIYVEGKHLDTLMYEPGQFMIWRFLDRERWWEAHPFTLSAPPNGRFLRLTIKDAGDFTSRAARIRPGTLVLIEGPFGHFTRRFCARPKALLIAGGIGITPIRALAEELAREGVNVCVLYRSHRDRDIAFRKELDKLATDHGVRVEYLPSDRSLLGRPAEEWLRPMNLAHIVPDVAEREVYVCGPAGLATYVSRGLETLGVAPNQIHTEAFSFR